MIVIERPRNSGKTTILLHYMVIDPSSVYVARTQEYADRAFHKAQALGLKISKDRFIGMSYVNLATNFVVPLLVDDAEAIVNSYPELGYNVIAQAKIITINEGAA